MTVSPEHPASPDSSPLSSSLPKEPPKEGAPKERPSFLNLFGRRQREQGLRDTIATLVNEAAEVSETPVEPELDRQERALIMNVLRLRGITADDVMVPRTDIVAMADDIALDEALDMMKREQHSRLPVYHGELDDIAGMIHVKDLVTAIGQQKPFELKALLRQPLFIAPTIPVLDLLLQMRQRRTHMALVIDEYGSIDGLVTIENLIETIVGDISDEHDEPVKEGWIERPDGSIDLDGRLPIRELEEKTGPFLTEAEREAEIETAGGLVFRLAEHVPVRDEVLTHPSGLEFRVLEADSRHIRRLRMRLPSGWSNIAAPPATTVDDSATHS